MLQAKQHTATDSRGEYVTQGATPLILHRVMYYVHAYYYPNVPSAVKLGMPSTLY